MGKKDKGRDFLFSKDCGFINEEDGDSYKHSDGSGYSNGKDGSKGYIYSDGSGYYHGADGSDGYIFSDGSAYYHGADGSDGYKFSDGSGYYHGADGSDGYKYSDGSGYFNSSDGNSDSYYANDDDDSTEDSSSSSDTDSTLSDSLTDVLSSVGSELIDAHFRKKEREREATRQQAEEEERQRAEEAKIRSAKHRTWRKKHRKGIAITVFALLVVVLAGIGVFEFRLMIPTGYSSDELIGMEYTQAVTKLEAAGFGSVRTEVITDLAIGDLAEDNCVTEVKIAWDDTFGKTTRFPSNFPVVVTYHTLMEISVPVSAKEAKNADYAEIEKAFLDAGFANVKTEADYDIITGWITKDGEVETVTIDGNNKFAVEDEFRPDAEVVITYHTWKKNKPE